MIDIESFTGDHVYLDANIFIYAVEGFPKYSALCSDILQSIEDMKIHAVTSELTLAEVLARPFKDQKISTISIYQELIRSQYDLKVVPISRADFDRSRQFTRNTWMSAPRCHTHCET